MIISPRRHIVMLLLGASSRQTDCQERRLCLLDMDMTETSLGTSQKIGRGCQHDQSYKRAREGPVQTSLALGGPAHLGCRKFNASLTVLGAQLLSTSRPHNAYQSPSRRRGPRCNKALIVRQYL